MQQQRCFCYFLQGCPECFHQRRRQIANESYRVAEEHTAVGGQCKMPDGWIQSDEHSWIRQNTRTRQAVEQCGFSRSGVSDKTDRGERNRLALPPLDGAATAHAFEIFLNFANPAENTAAIGLELRFAGAS